jgi:site-specific DNA-methyltransferase (cytosine-N4-specific)
MKLLGGLSVLKVCKTLFVLQKPITTGRLPLKLFHSTALGEIYRGDSLDLLTKRLEPASVDLIMTSPPFGLVRKKEYGNVDADKYVEWFKPFAQAFKRILKPSGSLVIDIGGAWNAGEPTRSLYHYELLISLCKESKFHLAQEFFWWNPARLPTPAEWVTVRRVRVKDAINCIWWLSPTPWPKASNKRVLQPYSDSMKDLLIHGYKPQMRPSGHDISDKFQNDNGGSIPPNLIAAAHTESNSAYIRYCTDKNLKPHPARFPGEIPEFFIRMLTDVNDLVLDPFAGSCVTGEVAERTKRRWVCCELRDDYLQGALGRFQTEDAPASANRKFSYKNADGGEKDFYRISKPGGLWNGVEGPQLPADGGFNRPPKSEKKLKKTTYLSRRLPRPEQLALMDAREHRTGKGKRDGKY